MPSQQNSNNQDAEPLFKKNGFLPFEIIKRRDYDSPLFHQWLWEFCSIVLGLVCMGAVLTILIWADGKALADWKSSIQPNSLISIFITIAKGSVLVAVASCVSQAKWAHFVRESQPLMDFQRFDDASRGPIGSLLLLFGVPRKDWCVSVAALITMTALSLDPLAQQIIAYPSRAVNATGTGFASFNVTQELGYDSVMDSPVLDLKSDLQGTVISGLYKMQSPSVGYCSTSNCIWPGTFASLGMCSRCQNVTSSSDQTCGIESSPIEGSDYSNALESCNYTTPSGATIPTWKYRHANGTASDTGAWTQGAVVSSTDGACMNNNYTCLTVVSSYYTNFLATDSGPWQDTPLASFPHQISSCDIYWCAHVYSNISFQSGVMDATPTFSYRLNATAQTSDESTNHETTLLQVTNDDAASPPFPGNRTFAINTSAHELIFVLLAVLLNSSTTVGYGNGALITAHLPVDLAASRSAAAVFSDGNATKSLDAMANAVSEYLRSIDDSTAMAGTAVSQETFIHVRWGWFSLPLAVVVVAAAYLGAVLVGERRRKGQIWKSSSLALLFHGLECCQDDDDELDTVAQMGVAAKGVRVQLKRGRGNRLMLVKIN